MKRKRKRFKKSHSHDSHVLIFIADNVQRGGGRRLGREAIEARRGVRAGHEAVSKMSRGHVGDQSQEEGRVLQGVLRDGHEPQVPIDAREEQGDAAGRQVSLTD